MEKSKEKKIEKKIVGVSFKFPEALIKKLKYVAYKDDTKQINIMINALEEYFTKWERKHGEIKP